MCKGDDVVVTGLAREGCRGVWWGGRSVDGYRVGEVAGCEERALEDIVVGRACNFDAGLKLGHFVQTAPHDPYREPTALYRFESSRTSLFEALPTFKFGVAILPAMLFRLLSAMMMPLCLAFRVPVSSRRLACKHTV